jgi:hypothetical protein
MWSVPDTVKAQSCFDHALTIARQQQAKSWELRAAMSLARLWRDQGKVQQARELLAPVYGWSFRARFPDFDPRPRISKTRSKAWAWALPW